MKISSLLGIEKCYENVLTVLPDSEMYLNINPTDMKHPYLFRYTEGDGMAKISATTEMSPFIYIKSLVCFIMTEST